MFIVHNKILSQYFSINLFQLLYSLPKFRLNVANVGFTWGSRFAQDFILFKWFPDSSQGRRKYGYHSL